MNPVTVKIREKPSDHDSDDVIWEVDGQAIGFGYKSRDDGSFHVTKCPKCRKENYTMQVAVGSCAWCGFNPN